MDNTSDIHYAMGLSSLGPVLVAHTEKGICAVLFAAPGPALVEDLAERFPDATPSDNSSQSVQWLQQVINFIESPAQPMQLPLDMLGTHFQKQVWQALLTIPAGQKVSYSQIAAQIDKPKAYRAVANACANNPIAVLVPCHRVVHKSGTASGYYWGDNIKTALQLREANA